MMVFRGHRDRVRRVTSTELSGIYSYLRVKNIVLRTCDADITWDHICRAQGPLVLSPKVF